MEKGINVNRKTFSAKLTPQETMKKSEKFSMRSQLFTSCVSCSFDLMICLIIQKQHLVTYP